MSSIKREIGHCHVVSSAVTANKFTKKNLMPLQSCCFAKAWFPYDRCDYMDTRTGLIVCTRLFLVPIQSTSLHTLAFRNGIRIGLSNCFVTTTATTN